MDDSSSGCCPRQTRVASDSATIGEYPCSPRLRQPVSGDFLASESRSLAGPARDWYLAAESRLSGDGVVCSPDAARRPTEGRKVTEAKVKGIGRRRGTPSRAGRRGPGAAKAEPRLHRTIWYMGAKARVIPGFLDRVVRREVPAGGTVVDLMSGTGVVAAHLANRYRVFAGDVQRYAQVIARSLLEHDPARKSELLASIDPRRDLGASYEDNLAELSALVPRSLAEERRLLGAFDAGRDDAGWCGAYREFIEATTSLAASSTEGGPRRGGPASELPELRRLIERSAERRPRPACLVTAYYANVYFGMAQSVAIDSLRRAIDTLPPDDPFAREKRTHYLSALLHAASTSTSGTSHFAQPRHLRKESELRAMARRRTTDVWTLFEEFSREIRTTVAETHHVAGNQVFEGDYKARLRPIGSSRSRAPGDLRFSFPRAPDLIYLDPPYTADNYSRFYHVLEVLVRYDYPRLATRRGQVLRGRYPEIGERFQSGFCHRSRVEEEFRHVIHGAAAAGAKLVISYSSPTGLLLKCYAREEPAKDPVARLESICREAYRRVRTERQPLVHSGQGDSNIEIEELLVVCTGPR